MLKQIYETARSGVKLDELMNRLKNDPRVTWVEYDPAENTDYVFLNKL